MSQLKQADQARKQKELEVARLEAKRLVAEGKMIGDVTYVSASVKHADRETLAMLADEVKASLAPKEGVVCLASGDQGTVSIVMATTAGFTWATT